MQKINEMPPESAIYAEDGNLLRILFFITFVLILKPNQKNSSGIT